jgi:hypothetical protein
VIVTPSAKALKVFPEGGLLRLKAPFIGIAQVDEIEVESAT